MTKLSELPQPDPQARAHCHNVINNIADKIKNSGGFLTFKDYMELVLYAPGLGYYVSGMQKFGAGGDFITAPEISPIFCKCVARQCHQILRETGGDILEFGAGSGVLATEILLELERLGTLPQRYCIVEISPDLQQRQELRFAKTIPHLCSLIVWLTTLEDVEFSGIVVANEVVDAMPVQRFCRRDRVFEIGVQWQNSALQLMMRTANEEISQAVSQLEQRLGRFPDGYESELNLLMEPWLRQVARILKKGAILIIDYGYVEQEYYHQQRNTGTMMCHFQHRAHSDPLVYPGLQDITSFVDFSRLAGAGVGAGLDLQGFTTQAHFLLGCGLADFVSDQGVDDNKSFMAHQEIKTLMLPGEMGERFKVIGFSKGVANPMMGFSLVNMDNRL